MLGIAWADDQAWHYLILALCRLLFFLKIIQEDLYYSSVKFYLLADLCFTLQQFWLILATSRESGVSGVPGVSGPLSGGSLHN